MNVITADPGETTGVAYWFDGHWDARQYPAWDAVDVIARALKLGGVDMVVSEEYRISRSTIEKGRQGMISIESIGTLKWLCRRYGVRFETISPADAKNFSTDAKLRALGWWTPGHEHARDASRVLLLALVKWYPGTIDLGKLSRQLGS